ncbi:MAG: septum formation protein Maf [Candidatus Omnitrophica bacterium]|nr:septum formation protein Maf [Candidatus Omnitrophota bacterium]
MPRLILASNSAQRKKLLTMLGLKFTVIPSRVEEVQNITTSCQSLVKHNAFIKANDVASRLKDGIVIGADSVVYVGGKTIIGKPKDLKDAKRILKLLFSRPHWVYTGVAVIDVKSGKKVVDYDKTKIFMTPLSDEEIDVYHQKMHPFDKAGGFDIEGYGSLFIRRIEGCYTNVIGLPIAKLSQILKQFRISILKGV